MTIVPVRPHPVLNVLPIWPPIFARPALKRRAPTAKGAVLGERRRCAAERLAAPAGRPRMRQARGAPSDETQRCLSSARRPLLAISGHTAGSSRTSALPPIADIGGARTLRIQKADIGCPLSPRKRTSGRRSRADCGPMTERVDLGGCGSVKSPRVSALHVQPAGEDQQIKLVACPRNHQDPTAVS